MLEVGAAYIAHAPCGAFTQYWSGHYPLQRIPDLAGLETLNLQGNERHTENAIKIAEYLKQHPKSEMGELWVEDQIQHDGTKICERETNSAILFLWGTGWLWKAVLALLMHYSYLHCPVRHWDAKSCLLPPSNHHPPPAQCRGT